MPVINFSGLASGIDSEALIQATSDAARSANVKPKEDQVTKLTEENDTIDELRTLLADLQDKASAFRLINGGALAKQAASTDETVATVSAANGAANTSFSLTVSQIARSATHSFNDRFTSTTTPIFPTLVGTDSITVVTGNGVGVAAETTTITVDNTTTLDSLATAINSASTNTRVVASIVNVADPGATASYAMVVTGLFEGEQKGELTITPGAGVTGAGVFTAATVNQAQNAIFTVSGLTGNIERSTNQVSDLFTGLTIGIEKTGTTTVTVGDDAAATTTVVQEYIDKYNEIVEFIKEKNLIAKESDDPDALNVFGPLASTGVDDGALGQMRLAISGASYSSGSEIRIMADLGITTTQSGTLKFNSDTLEQAIAKESASVREILRMVGDSNSALTGDGGDLDPYLRFQGLFDTTINGNKALITRLNDSISRAEASIAKQEQTLRSRFARLESLVGRLQSQQSALTSALAGLGG